MCGGKSVRDVDGDSPFPTLGAFNFVESIIVIGRNPSKKLNHGKDVVDQIMDTLEDKTEWTDAVDEFDKQEISSF